MSTAKGSTRHSEVALQSGREDRCRQTEDGLKFLQAVEQSSNIVMITDIRGIIEYVNPKLTQITGYSKEECIGEQLRTFRFSAATDQEYRQLLETITTGGTWQGEYENTKKNGEQYWESVSISPITNGEGTITHFLAIIEDISKRKLSEDKLEQANDELEEINEQLEHAIERANQLAFAAEAANVSKSEFLANMSHEIRTPLNGIIGMTELALDTQLTAEQQEYLKIVKASADSLLTLINDILDFSKIEAKKLDLDSIDFGLRDTLGDTLKTLAFRAHEKSLELTCHVLPDVQEALIGDPGRLRQIVVNLVSNAIKFTDQGEVVLNVKVETKTDDEVTLRFAVSDTGMGIPEDKQRLIFEPFAQGDGSRTRTHTGTGLGLAISKHLVEMMGGRLRVESEVGKGSTFFFTARFEIQKNATSETMADKPVEVRNLSVLVVDDNATNRRVLEEMLISWKMNPTAVDSAEAAIAALEKARERGAPFALIIMDANMPEVDGFSLAERITEDADLNSATIMMLTSAGLRGEAARCRELGVAAYLTKPIKESYLMDAILIAIGNKGQGEGTSPLITRHSLREGRPISAINSREGLRVLLAEDNLINQKLVIRLLDKKGHAVDVVNDGREALQRLQGNSYDLVLMDLQMPEMDGLAATTAIRENEKETGGHIPIIALTAHAMAGDRERCLKAGMDEYVSKPIEAEKLFKAIDNVVPAADEDGPKASRALQIDEAILDRNALSARVDGDVVLFEEIVALFLEEYPQAMSKIQEALDNRDCNAVQRAVHALKGAVGNLGAGAAYEAAVQLETIGRKGDLGQAEEAWLLFAREMNRFKAALQVLKKEGLS